MPFKDYSTTPSANTMLSDGTYIGPNMLRNKVRPALQQVAADGKALADEVEQITGPLTVTSASGQVVSTRILVAAIAGPVAGQSVYLNEEDYQGWFTFRTGDYSTEVASDVLQANYIAPTGEDGSTRAWVRDSLSSASLDAVTGPIRIGTHSLPTAFVDPIGGTVPVKGRDGWGFTISRVDALDTWAGESTTVHYYVSYTAGNDANDGLTSGTAVKTLSNVRDKVNDSASTNFVIHLLDKVHGSDSNISVNSNKDTTGKNVKWVAEDASGVCYWIGASMALTFTWTAAGANGAFNSSTADGQKVWRSAFDANFLDHEGFPTPLTFAASHAAVQTTPGSFYRDATGTTVHLRDGRVPSFSDGFILNGDTFAHNLRKDSGTDIYEDIYFFANDGTTSGGVFKYQHANTVDFSSTARLGFRRCRFGGGNGAALMGYDMDAALENCIGAYCSRDIFAYQTNGGFAATPFDARLHTVYEDNCVAYEAGYQGWNGSTLGASDNCSTGHQAHNMITTEPRYYTSKGAVIADVGGSQRVIYGGVAGDPGTGGTGLRPWVVWMAANTGEGVNPRTILIDFEAAVDAGQYALVRDGSHATAAIHVQAWRGDPTVPLIGLIKDYIAGTDLHS